MSGFVYFLRVAHRCSGVKIGYSKNPIKRTKYLESEIGIPLRLMGQVPGTFRDEKNLHKLFKDHRLHGEWFRTPRNVNTRILTLMSMKRIPKP